MIADNQNFDPKPLLKAFREAGKPLYLVGGAVRDQLMGKQSKDLDYTTKATPPEIKEILTKAKFPVIPIGEAFGTIATLLQAEFPDSGKFQVEITTFRTEESYKKGSRKPTVTFGDSLEKDLLRRDLTINAMALDDEGKLIDPFGGQVHLKEQLLITPSDASEIFGQDPLRMLRVARFMSKLGFTPIAEVRKAMHERAGLILTISRERWKQEMDKLLVGPFVSNGMNLLADTRLLQFILPEILPILLMRGVNQGQYHSHDIWGHTLKVIEGVPANATLRWAAMLHDVAKPHTRTEIEGKIQFLQHAELGAEMFDSIADRFRFSRDEKYKVKFLIEQHLRPNFYTSNWKDGTVRKLAEDAGNNLDDLLALSHADISASNMDRVRGALDNLDELKGRLISLGNDYSGNGVNQLVPTLPAGIGTALIEAFNLKPGPEVGKLKTKLLDAIREGALKNGQETSDYINFLKGAS